MRELDALAADLDVVHLPRGTRDLPADEMAAMVAGRVRVQVGVYAGGRMALMHSLGWLTRRDADEAVARLLDHLPGARLETERPRDARPRAVQQYAVHVIWGSRDPGWTPTAVRVSRALTALWRERSDMLTADEAAALVGVTASTWRAYHARGDAGVPRPLGDAPVGYRGRRLDVWDRGEVLTWHAARPGKGGRPARVEDQG